ncbi:ATP-dependent zinc protease [Candidatus Saccharibacteria bacterium]|nr:ATP-dependent zinc protease [Candidatus Saccharibacteria bacterium]
MINTGLNDKKMIGRATYLTLPQLELSMVPAKIDTGAYRSAIHASNIEIVNLDGRKVLRCNILGGHRSSEGGVEFETDQFKSVVIANSFGHKESRYEVLLRCVLAGVSFTTGFTLANRLEKIYPALIGRKATNGRFIVDTSLTDINRIELKNAYNINLSYDEEDSDL